METKNRIEDDNPQTYIIEEESLPEVPYKNIGIEGTNERKSFQDVYDMYALLTDVHSNISDMSRDYTLADYESGLINAKFPKFVIEQRKLVRILKAFLIIPKEILMRKYNNKATVDVMYNHIVKCYQDCENLLLGELDEMVIVSRAGKGTITNAIIMHGRTQEEREEMENETRVNQGLSDQLNQKV